MTATDRRSFLQLSGFAIAGSLLPRVTWAGDAARFFSAYTKHDGSHCIGVLDQTGRLLTEHPVPSRGHSACISGDGRRVAFVARRPRRWLMVLDVAGGELIQQTRAAEGRHFYGHAVFSDDGKLLYVPENDYENGRGLIGVYEVDNALHKVSEMPSFGVGPHELGLLSDGKTLVVANGGIRTHPDYGRIKLNLDEMSSSLTYIDIPSAGLLGSFNAPHNKLSLRHLAISNTDHVVVGAQLQGEKGVQVPVVYGHQWRQEHEGHERHKEQSPLEPYRLPAQNRPALAEHYIASVAVDADGRYAVTTAPRDGKATLWDMKTATWLFDVNIADVAGVCWLPEQGRAMLSSGSGMLYELDVSGRTLRERGRFKALQWDNHMAGIHLQTNAKHG